MKKLIPALLLSVLLLNGISTGIQAQQATRVELVAMKKTKEAIAALNITPDAVVPYKTVGDVTLNLSVFNPTDSSKKPSACIVFFFGGGFKIGTPDQFYPQCEFLASRGIVAISAEYRTKSTHGTPPNICVTDAKSAMRWVRAHAKELNIDPNRIAAGGGSAGGFLAATTATSTCFDEKGEDTSVSCVPNALVIFNSNFNRGPGTLGFNAVKKMLGDNWTCYSPLHCIKPGFPPTIYQVGTNDRFIPLDEAKLIKSEIEKVGSRCDLHIYEGQEHSFYNYAWKEGTYYEITLNEADNFLASIGWYKK